MPAFNKKKKKVFLHLPFLCYAVYLLSAFDQFMLIPILVFLMVSNKISLCIFIPNVNVSLNKMLYNFTKYLEIIPYRCLTGRDKLTLPLSNIDIYVLRFCQLYGYQNCRPIIDMLKISIQYLKSLCYG